MASLESIEKTVAALVESQARLTTLVEGLHNSCPHRESIARGANNIERVKALEINVKKVEEKEETDIKEVRETVHKNQLSIARVAALVLAGSIGGGLVGASAIDVNALQRLLSFFT